MQQLAGDTLDRRYHCLQTQISDVDRRLLSIGATLSLSAVEDGSRSVAVVLFSSSSMNIAFSSERTRPSRLSPSERILTTTAVGSQPGFLSLSLVGLRRLASLRLDHGYPTLDVTPYLLAPSWVMASLDAKILLAGTHFFNRAAIDACK